MTNQFDNVSTTEQLADMLSHQVTHAHITQPPAHPHTTTTTTYTTRPPVHTNARLHTHNVYRIKRTTYEGIPPTWPLVVKILAHLNVAREVALCSDAARSGV